MIYLHKGSVIDYAQQNRSAGRGPSPIYIDGDRYVIRIEASHPNNLAKGESVQLTAHIFDNMTGEELEINPTISWERYILGITDRNNKSDKEYNQTPPQGKSIIVSYDDLCVNGKFTASVAEKEIKELIEEKGSTPSLTNKLIKGSYTVHDDLIPAIEDIPEEYKKISSKVEHGAKTIEKIEEKANAIDQSLKTRIPTSVQDYFIKHSEELRGKDGRDAEEVRANLLINSTLNDDKGLSPYNGSVAINVSEQVLTATMNRYAILLFSMTEEIEEGAWYTLSFDVRSDTANALLDYNFFVSSIGKGNIGFGWSNRRFLTSEWQRISITMQIPRSDKGSFGVGCYGQATSLQIRKPKLEKGKTATAWIANGSSITLADLNLSCIDTPKGIQLSIANESRLIKHGESPKLEDVVNTLNNTKSFHTSLSGVIYNKGLVSKVSNELNSNDNFLGKVKGRDGKDGASLRENLLKGYSKDQEVIEIGRGKLSHAIRIPLSDLATNREKLIGFTASICLTIKAVEKKSSEPNRGLSFAIQNKHGKALQYGTAYRVLFDRERLNQKQVVESFVQPTEAYWQEAVYVGGYLTDYGSDEMNYTLHWVKIEAVYQGESERATAFVPHKDEMISVAEVLQSLKADPSFLSSLEIDPTRLVIQAREDVKNGSSGSLFCETSYTAGFLSSVSSNPSRISNVTRSGAFQGVAPMCTNQAISYETAILKLSQEVKGLMKTCDALKKEIAQLKEKNNGEASIF